MPQDLRRQLLIVHVMNGLQMSIRQHVHGDVLLFLHFFQLVGAVAQVLIEALHSLADL